MRLELHSGQSGQKLLIAADKPEELNGMEYR